MGCRVNLYFYFQFTIDPLLVLIEYVPYGDLLGYLRKSRGLNDTYFKDPDVKPQTNLTSEQLMRFAWQIADGMFYLSSRKVCGSFYVIISPVNVLTLKFYFAKAFQIISARRATLVSVFNISSLTKKFNSVSDNPS